MGSSHCTDGKAEAQRNCPSIQNHTQWQKATPKALPRDSALGALDCEGREEGEPSKGMGRYAGTWGVISQAQGLALSPVWPKKQLMRLQGQRFRVRIPRGLRFPSCIIAIRTGMGWVPQQLLTLSLSAACWAMRVGGDSPSTSAHMPYLAMSHVKEVPCLPI